jgi:pseudouridine synthase
MKAAYVVPHQRLLDERIFATVIMLRLNRYLAMCGVCSRRHADALILSGAVAINGKVVRTLGTQIDPAGDEIKVRGARVRAVDIPTYVMLNKPAGYVTTTSDEKGRAAVLQLVRTPIRLFPVGRLDRDSEGLLLLTNDGELAHRLMHPRYKAPKVYRVILQQAAPPGVIASFRRGVKIDAFKPAKGELRFLPGNRRFCEVTIVEGRNRQVRRMFEALGCRVKNLQRIRLGPLALGSLPVGAWRYLNRKEIAQLKQAVVGRADGNS